MLDGVASKHATAIDTLDAASGLGVEQDFDPRVQEVVQAARQQGDALLVGLNSDGSVRQLKGEGRPVNEETDRAAVLAALQAVDAVCIFPELRATRFLALAQPDIYVKGGDFTLDQLPQEEREVVEKSGGKIITVGFVPGKSTTALLKRIARL